MTIKDCLDDWKCFIGCENNIIHENYIDIFQGNEMIQGNEIIKKGMSERILHPNSYVTNISQSIEDVGIAGEVSVTYTVSWIERHDRN